jgi:hypothetical protein
MINSINIPKTIKSQSTGNQETVAQAFSQNYWVKSDSVKRIIDSWETPVYTLEGATRNFYSIDYNGLSTDINNGKNITFVFTANTESISGITTLNHKMYKIDYKDFIEAKKDISSTAFTQTIINNLNSPFYVFSDYATGSTGIASSISAGRYTFNFPNEVKPENQFTISVFKDKSQYFIDSEFVFPMSINKSIGDFYILSSSSKTGIVQTLDYYKNNYQLLTSNLGTHIITGNTPFSGFSVQGAFFTYMIPPNKPNLYVSNGNGQIAVQGLLTTFSPTFNFSNVEDGDYYQLQVTYDVTDYLFEDSSVATFQISKQEGDAEFVRTFAVPLTPRKQFLYRIGNVKEIENIFGVKQSTVVYTDYVFAETASDGKFILSGTAYQNYIDPINILAGVTFELRGAGSSSTIRKKIDLKNTSISISQQDQIIGNVSNVLLSTTSDVDGNYSFGRIDGGTYYLTVIPPSSLSSGLDTRTYIISINSDTDFDVVLSAIWGSTSITFDNDQYLFF